jgi:formiminotetrahydrofolate cyclodeaminase
MYDIININMNTDPIQILSIVRDFKANLDVLKSKQNDLSNRIKKTIDNNRLLRIRKDLNN